MGEILLGQYSCKEWWWSKKSAVWVWHWQTDIGYVRVGCRGRVQTVWNHCNLYDLTKPGGTDTVVTQVIWNCLQGQLWLCDILQPPGCLQSYWQYVCFCFRLFLFCSCCFVLSGNDRLHVTWLKSLFTWFDLHCPIELGATDSHLVWVREFCNAEMWYCMYYCTKAARFWWCRMCAVQSMLLSKSYFVC